MKTLIVEDQALFRDLLTKVCEMYFKFDELKSVGTGALAEKALAETAFDLVILDIDLPDRDGFKIAESLVGKPSGPRVLGLSAYCDEFTIYRVINSTLHGFVDKTEQSIDSLRTAIETVSAGKFYFAEVVRRVQLALREDPSAFPKLLTDKEFSVLGLIGAGKTNDDIGATLGISATTAQWHRKQIMRKLNIHSATDLVVYAAEKGFSRLGSGRSSPKQ